MHDFYSDWKDLEIIWHYDDETASHRASVEFGNLFIGPDCKIGNWAENWWMRTFYGVKGKWYSTLGRCKQAITMAMRAHHKIVDEFIIINHLTK
jgi:hypothetical protein